MKPIEFSVFPRADGTWVMRYRADANCWKQRRLGNQRDAQAAERAGRTWLAERVAARDLPAATMTVDAAADQWLAHRAVGDKVSGATVRDNEDQLKNWIRPAFGKTPIGMLTPKMLGAWVAEIRGKVSASRCNNIVNTFSSFYQYARASEWVKAADNIVRHPAVRQEVPSNRGEREEAVTMPLEHAQRLATETPDNQRRLRYLLAFTSGLRDGELAGILAEDIDLAVVPPTVRIRKALALRAERGTHAVVARPKTNESKRVLPLHDEAAVAIGRWLTTGWEQYTGEPMTPTSPLFPSPKTAKAWRPKSAEFIREDLAALGLPTVTTDDIPIDFHATRRSFNTWLTEAGVSETIRDRIMGHTGKTTAERHYTGRMLAKMHEAVMTVPMRWAPLAQSPVLAAPLSPEPYAESCAIVNIGEQGIVLRNRCSTTELRRPTGVFDQNRCTRTRCAPVEIPTGTTRTLPKSDLGATVLGGRLDAERRKAKRTTRREREVAQWFHDALMLATDGATVLSVAEREAGVGALLAKLAPRVVGDSRVEDDCG